MFTTSIEPVEGTTETVRFSALKYPRFLGTANIANSSFGEKAADAMARTDVAGL